MNTTELLEQCQKWHEDDEFDKIIEALEALDAATRGAELDSILARAYNNAADPETEDGKAKLERAIELLKAHEDEHSDIDVWNFRLAYAYYYLDRELSALHYFKRAAKLDPDDEDAPQFVESCRRILSLPMKRVQFRERVEQAWSAFVERESHIREALEADKDHSNGAAIVSEISDIFEKALSSVALEVGFNGSKYELILSSEGNLLQLFMLVYLRKHMPESLNEHWSVLVGRHSDPRLAMRMGDVEVSAEDIQVWVSGEGTNFTLEMYCSKLNKLMQENEDQVWFILRTMTDQVLGEVAQMHYISDFDVLSEPKDGDSVLLSELPQKMKELGADTSMSAEEYIENSYVAYHAKPDDEEEYEFRDDIIAGSTRCVNLLAAYNAAASGDEDADLEMNALYDSGAIAGFIAYPLNKFEGEDRAENILNFREAFVEHLNKVCGPDVFMFLGGATGTENGYIDLIAWDLKPVLEAAESFVKEHDEIDAAAFKTFLYESESLGILNPDSEDSGDSKGSFVNFVLLDEAEFDKQQLIADLKAQWDIDAIEDDDEDDSEDSDDDKAKSEDILLFEHEGMRGVVMILRGPIPNDEAVLHAHNNFMWPEAEEVAQKHKAHLLVTVLGDDDDDELMNRAIFHTKLTAACCAQKHATAVDFAGCVVSNEVYAKMANFIKDDELPLFNWIWFGLHKTEEGFNAYTYGMGVFGKKNMEVSSPDASPEELRNFMINMAHYVIDTDAELEDGQTIGFSPTDKHSITLSKGIALPDEMTLKVSFKADVS